jgi:plastocyanin
MKKVGAFLVLALAALALAACGSSNNGSSSTATTGGETTESQGEGAATNQESTAGSSADLKFEADPNGELSYTTNHATAKAGKVTVEFTNPQSLTHDVAIENSKGEEVASTELIANGSDSTTANLKPGTYTYFCTVPGHREAGMEGTLVVK